MKIIAPLLLLCTFSFSGIASDDLTYPELQVTPRATQRIKLEIKEEAGGTWSSHASVQLSSLATLTAGLMSSGSVDDEKDEKEISPLVATGVGAVWLGVTTWAAMKHRPYRAAYLKLKKMPYRSKRDKLTKERLAEEELNRLKTLGNRVRWFSFATNLGASAFLLSSVNSDTDAQIMASISSVLAFGPLFFKYKWETVADEQEKYKKKIYAPVAMGPILRDPFKGTSATGVNLLFTF